MTGKGLKSFILRERNDIPFHHSFPIAQNLLWDAAGLVEEVFILRIKAGFLDVDLVTDALDLL